MRVAPIPLGPARRREATIARPESRNATRRVFEFAAVDDVGISVDAGDFFALLGPSGCGKTTLLRMISEFDLPDPRAIVLDGAGLTDTPPERW
jgi:spermidine/putrescine transport system ATP-binding protein